MASPTPPGSASAIRRTEPFGHLTHVHAKFSATSGALAEQAADRVTKAGRLQDSLDAFGIDDPLDALGKKPSNPSIASNKPIVKDPFRVVGSPSA